MQNNKNKKKMPPVFSRDPSPIRPDMLTQSLSNYARLFSVGAPVPGSKWNAVYTDLNFVGYHYTQKSLTDEMDEDVPIPIFSFEKPNAHRQYTMCSYWAMILHVRRAERRHFYHMLPPKRPLHFFCDFDLSKNDMDPSSHGKRSINAAMAEFLGAFEDVMRRLRCTIPEWSSYNGDYTVSVLYGNKTGKQSAHMVVHLADSHMFEDVVSCRNLYSLIVSESMVRHPNLEDNPLFFKPIDNGKAGCILDWQVYSFYRNFRTVASEKNKEDRSKIAGRLSPACPDFDVDAEGTGCSNPDCFYHVHGDFLDTDFLANDPTFIPRLASGAASMPTLLRVPNAENPLLKRNKKRSAAAVAASEATTLKSAFSLFSRSSSLSGNETNGSIIVTPLSRTASIGASAAIVNASASLDVRRLRARCFGAIARLVASATGSACEVSESDAEGESVLITSDSHTCPYWYRTQHPTADRDAIGEMHHHESNHVCFLASIRLPLPSVSWRCTDMECREFIATFKRYVPVDVSTAPEEHKEAYLAVARAYLLSTEYPVFAL